MGVNIEKAVKESGIEDLGEELKVKFGQDKPGHKIKFTRNRSFQVFESF